MLWMKVASALEGLIYLISQFNSNAVYAKISLVLQTKVASLSMGRVYSSGYVLIMCELVLQ